MLYFHIENRYSGVLIFEKFDSRVFKSGDIVHFLGLTHRKASPCNGFQRNIAKGAWDQIWRESPIFWLKMTRAGLHQINFTKHLQPKAPGVEKNRVRRYINHTSKYKNMYIFKCFTHLCPKVLKNLGLLCRTEQNFAFLH